MSTADAIKNIASSFILIAVFCNVDTFLITELLFICFILGSNESLKLKNKVWTHVSKICVYFLPLQQKCIVNNQLMKPLLI